MLYMVLQHCASNKPVHLIVQNTANLHSYLSHDARRYMSNGMIHIQRPFREFVCAFDKF